MKSADTSLCLSKLKLIITLMMCLALFSSMALAQECVPEDWCGAPWPPAEGSDRTEGKDSCGNTCIKIAIETTVEVIEVVEVEVEKIVEKIVEVEKQSGEVKVTLLQDDNGRPVMTASCPGTFSWYKLRAVAIENGCVEKMRTKSGITRIMFEECKSQ